MPITVNDVNPAGGALYYNTNTGGVDQAASGGGATYWVGQDGNIYYGSGQTGAPVQNLGSSTNGQFQIGANGLYDKFTDTGTPTLTYAAQQISDPSATATLGAHTAPIPSSTGGSSTPVPIFNQAGANNTQNTINQIPGLLQNALTSENTTYNNTKGAFDAQEKTQRDTYNKSSETNQKNYDSNFMDSIRAGIKGLGGLMALLRGTGAGGGSAQDAVRNIVSDVTSGDIRNGADTRNQNQTGLDTSLGTFLTDLSGKRKKNEDTNVNNIRSIKSNSDSTLQDLYGKMAGYYSDVNNQSEYNRYMAKANGLTPSIAQNNQTQVSSYDTTPVSVKAPSLSAFDNPTQPSVQTGDSGRIGSGIFTITNPNEQKRKKDLNQVPLTTGA